MFQRFQVVGVCFCYDSSNLNTEKATVCNLKQRSFKPVSVVGKFIQDYYGSI